MCQDKRSCTCSAISEEPQRIEGAGSYATESEQPTGEYYVWDHSIGDVINALIGAGLQIEFLHEFPYAARAKFPSMEHGQDRWWRLPAEQHGTILFLFSLQARTPDRSIYFLGGLGPGNRP